MTRTLAAICCTPCSTDSRHVPRTARMDWQRLDMTMAAAPYWTMRMAASVGVDLVSLAICLTTEERFFGLEASAISFRFDSRDCTISAAFAGPQGPSHQYRKFELAAGV